MNMNTWQPISTAPRDGTEIIVGYDCASVWICHVAWRRVWEDWMNDFPESFDKKDAGWFSYIENSVTQHYIGTKPTHWIPLPKTPTK